MEGKRAETGPYNTFWQITLFIASSKCDENR